MNYARCSILILVMALAGCMDRSKPVEVRILPDSYQVGEVKSTLATPAVDEVVRIKPSKVLVMACLTTPPAKVIQFDTELKARLQTELQLTTVEQGCPA